MNIQKTFFILSTSLVILLVLVDYLLIFLYPNPRSSFSIAGVIYIPFIINWFAFVLYTIRLLLLKYKLEKLYLILDIPLIIYSVLVIYLNIKITLEGGEYAWTNSMGGIIPYVFVPGMCFLYILATILLILIYKSIKYKKK